jgi:hypothetical protein
MSLVKKRSMAENARVAADIRTKIEVIAREMAVMPAEQEMSEFERYRAEFMIAVKSALPETTSA